MLVTPSHDRLVALAATISSRRFRVASEADLQVGVERILKEEGETFEREAIMSKKDRIDFLLADRIGIELKIAGSTSDVIRQLMRYAENERVAALLLVTTRMIHRGAQGQMNGKPVVVCHLMSGIL